MCPLMIKKGHQVTCFNRSGDKVENEYVKTVKRKKYRGVQLKKVITINKRGLAAMTSSFSAAICAAFGKYDVVHFHAEGPCAMLWLPKLFGKRCIATIHGLDHKRAKWGKLASAYIMLGEKVAAKYADSIIVLSRAVQEYFRNIYGRETVFIPNGVNKPQIVSPDLITREYNLQKEGYILYLGRLVPEKGIKYLIEAFKQVHTNKRLVIAGGASDTDEYAKELVELAQEDKRIIFTGFVQGRKLEELYSNAYLYVLPSDLEGMPLSLLEAMSYGNCCIVSDIPECLDVVRNNGIVFKKGNVLELAEKLQDVCDYPEKVMRYKENSAQYVCNKYNWDDVVKKTLELYKNS